MAQVSTVQTWWPQLPFNEQPHCTGESGPEQDTCKGGFHARQTDKCGWCKKVLCLFCAMAHDCEQRPRYPRHGVTQPTDVL